MRLEPLEIRDLLAANTLDFVDNLEIAAPGDTRDLQLEVDGSSAPAVVGFRVHGTSGDLNPDIPLVFIQDTDRNNPANHVALTQAMADSNGTTDSFVMFQVNPGDKFTIQVGGSSGAGGFRADVMLFGSKDSDGGVSEYEYMCSVAAELQARGAGNQNTAAYFQSVYGIDFNQSQYDQAFDANLNGMIDSFEVGLVENNYNAGGNVILDLIGDNEAPVATAHVVTDTGRLGDDNITKDTTGITGTITDFSKIVHANVSIVGGNGSSYDLADTVSPPAIDLLNQTDNQITFTLSTADLDALLSSGTVVNSGPYTLQITTEDELGNTTITPYTFDFEFDTDPPSPPSDPDLLSTSDSADDADNITSDNTPTFSVQTEANAIVEFFTASGSLGTATADNTGLATFTVTSPLADDDYTITATATDVAGNTSTVSGGLALTIDTTPPTAISDLALTNPYDVAHPLLIADGSGLADFSGKTEAGATVEVLLGGSVVASGTAAGGDFSFSSITFDHYGANTFTFRATDKAGNTTTADLTVVWNPFPVITANQSLSVDENSSGGAAVGTVDANDGDDNNETLVYEIATIDGVTYDGSLFDIDPNTGQVTVAQGAALDYETDNQYDLEIKVTDSYGDGNGGNLSVMQSVLVNINDVNEAPTINSGVNDFSVDENSPNTITSLGTVSATDPDFSDSLTYAITGGTGSGTFAIDSSTGEITVADNTLLNFETNPSLTLEVTVTDNGGPTPANKLSAVRTFSIAVNNVNEAPTITSSDTLSVDENSPADTVVGTVTISDPDTDDNSSTAHYSVTGGTGSSIFSIDPSNGQIKVTDASALDYELGTTSWTLDVKVEDNLTPPELGTVLSDTQTITISLNDLNETPTTTLGGTFYVAENSPNGTKISTDTAGLNTAILGDYFADQDAGANGTLTYSIEGGDPNSVFSMVYDAFSGDSYIIVNDPAGLNHEDPLLNSYDLTIRATDGGNPAKFVEGTVHIDVTNVNELPTVDSPLDLGLVRYSTVDEAGETGNTVKTIGLIDPDLPHTPNTYANVTPGTNFSPYFTVNAFGEVILNQEIPQSVMDANNGTLHIDFAIDVVDPIDSNFTENIIVQFDVVVNEPPAFDYPALNTQISVNENLLDGVNNDLAVNDVIDPSLNILATDPEGDNPITYSVEANSSFSDPALAALFDVALANDSDGIDGEYTLVLADSLHLRYNYVNDHGASNGVFMVDLVATDTLGGSSRRSIQITVNNLNDTPTFIAPSPALTVEELVQHKLETENNIHAGDFVYDLSQSFLDADNPTNDPAYLDYTITNSTVDAFELAPNGYDIQIKDPSLLDYEALSLAGNTNITLTIQAADPGGKMISKDITISVLAQDELPLFTSPTSDFDVRYKFVDSTDQSDNLTDLGTIQTVLDDVDPESGNLNSISYLQRTDGLSGDGIFKIGLDGTISLLAPVDLGSNDSQLFQVSYDYTDGILNSNSDLGYTDGFILNILVAKNPPPVFQSADNFSIDENTAASSDTLLTVSAVDPEGESVTYAFKDPNSTFAIDGTTGVITLVDNAALDYETNTSLQFTVIATDSAGNEVPQLITVNINDVNEAPTIDSGANDFNIDENSAFGVSVGTLLASDVDAGDQGKLSYAITGGTGSTAFSINSSTGEITVADSSQLNYEATQSFTLDVTVTDNGGPTPGSNQLSDSITLNIGLNNVDDAPELTGSTFNLAQVDESQLTTDEAGVEDAFYTKTYSGQQFLSQFTDQDGDTLDLTIANKAYLESLDFIHSIDYDNNSDTLTITFVHFGVDQNRDPDLNNQTGLPSELLNSGQAFFIEFTAQETSTGTLQAADPLWVGVDITLKHSMEFQFIPVNVPTSSTRALANISEGELPQAVDKVVDGQTLYVEIWGTTLVPRTSVTDLTSSGGYVNSWLKGFKNLNLDFTFNTQYLQIDDVNGIFAPNRLTGSGENITVDNVNGTIKNFNNSFGNTGVEFTGVAEGGFGDYVRIGYITLTVKDGASSAGSDIGDLVNIDLNSNFTAMSLIAANTADIGGDGSFLNRTAELQADPNDAQYSFVQHSVQVVNGYVFAIDSNNSQAVLQTGANGSTINNVQIAAQGGGDGNGNVTTIGGAIYAVLDDPLNPTQLEIVGSNIELLDSSFNFVPPIPGSQNSADPGNFGFTATDANNVDLGVAVRETAIELPKGITINLSGDATTTGGATFDSKSFDLTLSRGALDVLHAVSSFEQATTRLDATGTVIGPGANAEAGKLTSNQAGTGFTLDFNLARTLLNSAFDVNTFAGTPYAVTMDLLMNATITASVNGGSGVPLQGSVYSKNGQPLTSGSGVFVTVNKDKTQTDANGQVSELPKNADWATEWDNLWVEVWGNTADATGILGGTVDLGYDTSLFTATQIEYASSMSQNHTGTIDDANGVVTGLGSGTNLAGLGNGNFVLLGRVKLESIGSDGIDVTLNEDLKPQSLGLTVSNADLKLASLGVQTPSIISTGDVDVWGVVYDVNNDGRVGLSDYNTLLTQFGKSSKTDNSGLVAALDFNNDGKVGLSDYSYYLQNLGKTRENQSPLTFPDTFRQTWLGDSISVSGPNTVQEVFDKAVSDWQAALGWQDPIDVKLVVTDLPDAQLGEADLLGTDAQGLPQFGVLTIDVDGAGLGWSTDLTGGPVDGKYDLYTVMLHELGHLYGFMSHYSGFSENVVTDYNGNQVFIGADFMALLDDYAQHLDQTEYAGDVMNAQLDPGQRKTISDLDVKILETAYQTAMTDAANALSGGGSAALVGSTVADASPSTPIESSISTPVETIAPVMSDATTSTASDSLTQPISFVFSNVADVEKVSGRTGFESSIPPVIYNALVRNGVRVTTSSSTEVQQQIDDIDSAVATLTADDTALLVADSVNHADALVSEDDSTHIDDLFADWDNDSDLEG